MLPSTKKNHEILETSKQEPALTVWQFQPTKQYYEQAVQLCCSPEKSFSVEEQQEAGCTGSDTVQACMDKLTRHCIHNAGQQLHIQDDMQEKKENLQHQKVLFKNISLKIGEMEQLMQNLLIIIP